MSLRLAFDEDVDHGIVRGLRRRIASVDGLTVQDAGLVGTDDDRVLAWAASEGRVLVTMDRQTMVGRFYRAVESEAPPPGLVVVSRNAGLGRVLDDLVLIVLAAEPGEVRGQVWYVPL